jgi:hypothetical protein
MNIKPAHYTLRSRRDRNDHHLLFWTLEGSRDVSEWIELDRRENNTERKSREAIATFPVSRSDEVHLIRLRQFEKNSSNSDYLDVGAIEVFGVLVEPKQ